MGEPEAIVLAQSGDPLAFERLYELHHKSVFNQCRRMIRNETEAEDVTQEVFLLLWRKINLFKSQCSFTTWLFRLTANRAISHIRKRKHDAVLAFVDIPENGQFPDQHARLEMLDALDKLKDMERFCVEAEISGQSLRHHGGAKYLQAAAKDLRTNLRR